MLPSSAQRLCLKCPPPSPQIYIVFATTPPSLDTAAPSRPHTPSHPTFVLPFDALPGLPPQPPPPPYPCPPPTPQATKCVQLIQQHLTRHTETQHRVETKSRQAAVAVDPALPPLPTPTTPRRPHTYEQPQLTSWVTGTHSKAIW